MFIWVHSISYSCIQIHTHYGSEHTVAYIAQAPIDQGVKKFVKRQPGILYFPVTVSNGRPHRSLMTSALLWFRLRIVYLK